MQIENELLIHKADVETILKSLPFGGISFSKLAQLKVPFYSLRKGDLMYLVRVVPASEEAKTSTLSPEMLSLLSAILNNTVHDSKEFSKRCCQAGLCPLVFRERLKSVA